MANILLLDNIDSFTFNLVDQLRSYGHSVTVYRNTTHLNHIISHLESITSPIIVLSPGPGRPESAGCMLSLIEYAKDKYPIIGICLGHQALIQAFGGKVVSAPEIVHGRASAIHHDNQFMFQNLPNPLNVARYHSLVGDNLPNELVINSTYYSQTTTQDTHQMIMSFRHKSLKIAGFQFHPESILTPQGERLLNQVLDWCLKDEH